VIRIGKRHGFPTGAQYAFTARVVLDGAPDTGRMGIARRTIHPIVIHGSDIHGDRLLVMDYFSIL
jgi:hypothetical protein